MNNRRREKRKKRIKHHIDDLCRRGPFFVVFIYLILMGNTDTVLLFPFSLSFSHSLSLPIQFLNAYSKKKFYKIVVESCSTRIVCIQHIYIDEMYIHNNTYTTVKSVRTQWQTRHLSNVHIKQNIQNVRKHSGTA